MADNLVLIKIKVDADTKEIDKVTAKLAALRGEASLLGDDMDDLGDSADDADGSIKRVGGSARGTSKDFNNLDKNSNKLNKWFEVLDKVAKKFGDFLQGFLRVSLKLIAVNFASMAASLLSVKAAFAIGRFAMKAWQATLAGASAAGAVFITVLSGIAAGQRQWNAALQAYNYKSSPGLT